MFEKQSGYTHQPCFQMLFLAKFLAAMSMRWFSDTDYAGARSRGSYVASCFNFNAITKIIFCENQLLVFYEILYYKNLELYGIICIHSGISMHTCTHTLLPICHIVSGYTL